MSTEPSDRHSLGDEGRRDLTSNGGTTHYPLEMWLDAARDGDSESLGRVLEISRGFLRRVADRGLAPDLKAKEGASDLVQETLLKAHRDFWRFTGQSEAELRAWLRGLMLNCLAHTVRRYRGSVKRQISREVSLGSQDAGGSLVADDTSPGSRAVRHEEERALSIALGRLPERMRQAVLWRHHDHCTFAAMGERLGCSTVAARNLWLRGLKQLHVELWGEARGDLAGST